MNEICKGTKGFILTSDSTTMEQIKEYYHNDTQRYKKPITQHANKKFKKSLRPLECCKCGYKKHVEIAHIRAISDFPDSATIGEINSIENLMALCPNCHWEHDHQV